MQGVLRLYLALCVMHVHAFHYMGLQPMAFWWRYFVVPSTQAVVCFFVASGIVAYHQLAERAKTQDLLGLSMGYYLDRAVRLYPAYSAAALIGVYCFLSGLAGNITDGKHVAAAALNVFPPVFAIMLQGSREVFGLSVNPPVWSLGVEMIYFAAAPLLAFLSQRHRFGSVFVLTAFGAISMALLSARFDPSQELLLYFNWLFNAAFFVFAMLVFGPMTARMMPSRQAELAGWVVPLVFMACQGLRVREPEIYSLNTMAFYVTFALVFVIAGRADYKKIGTRWLGSLAYTVFLLHVPIFWIIRSTDMTDDKKYFAGVILTIAGGFMLTAADMQIQNWRRAFRDRTILLDPAAVADRPGYIAR